MRKKKKNVEGEREREREREIEKNRIRMNKYSTCVYIYYIYARYVSFGGSGGMKTIAVLELPSPQVISQDKIRDESFRRGKLCNSEGL